MADRQTQFKNIGKDMEALRNNRTEQVVSIRKEKQDDIMFKRRNIQANDANENTSTSNAAGGVAVVYDGSKLEFSSGLNMCIDDLISSGILPIFVNCLQSANDGLTRHWAKRPETRAAMRAEIVVKPGGRAAEELVYGASPGHYSDMDSWEAKAKKIVKTSAEWCALTAGQRTRNKLARRAERIIARAFRVARGILTRRQPLLHGHAEWHALEPGQRTRHELTRRVERVIRRAYRVAGAILTQRQRLLHKGTESLGHHQSRNKNKKINLIGVNALSEGQDDEREDSEFDTSGDEVQNNAPVKNTLQKVTCVASATSDVLTTHWAKRPETTVVNLGGRAAEEHIYGLSLGHYSDMAQWNTKAKKALTVCLFGSAVDLFPCVYVGHAWHQN
uniref:IBB domain-containing protein n=1 Tax=Globodera rostochiensis TaxID=31243 RepID=A0A914HPP8_GLORO